MHGTPPSPIYKTFLNGFSQISGGVWTEVGGPDPPIPTVATPLAETAFQPLLYYVENGRDGDDSCKSADVIFITVWMYLYKMIAYYTIHISLYHYYLSRIVAIKYMNLYLCDTLY